jgi:hypothetical protein
VFDSWEAFYRSQAQGVWALLVLPVLFLAWLAARHPTAGAGVEPGAGRFVRGWAVLCALLAIADPIATGLLGWPLLPFVLLGDFRVLALAVVVMQPGRARASALLEAAAWTFVVPAVAYGVWRAIAAAHGAEPPGMLLWLAYEIAFVLVVLAWWTRIVPARVPASRAATRRYVGRVLAVVAAYYVLWALADVVILAGRDWGWALRVVPNQLYYGVLVPVAYALFFAAPSVSASTSTHAVR